MLVTSKQLLLDAQHGHYAVGAFNTSDLEITKAIITAATRLNSPVIVETSEKAIAYAGIENLANIVQNEAKKARVSVALHLDHGKSLEIIRKCLDAGYTSVMFDGSYLSYQENIILTRQAVEMAHRANRPCEGEIGAIGAADETRKYTDPNQVVEFVRKTGVDFLAVAIGSAHGIGGDEKLDINLLKKIHAKIKIPLVLHGASGVSDEDIKEAIKNGIAKINIDTDIRHTFSRTIRAIGRDYHDFADPREVMQKIMTEIQKVVEEKIKLFGSEGKG